MNNQLFDAVKDGDLEKVRNNLLDYCKMDTYAMVKILQKLYTI